MSHPRRLVLKIVLLAFFATLLVVSVATLASAQSLGGGVGGVRVDVDVGTATGAVDGALDTTDRLVGSTLDVALGDEITGIVGGVDATGLTGGTDAASGASLEAAGLAHQARPLTSQETAVVGGMAAAAGVGFFVWLQGVLGFGGARFLGAPLFSRIEKDALLDNEGRETLMGLVEANPGIGLKELSEQSGLGWGTTVYHASRLEGAGFVSSMKRGQNRHFFKNGHPAARMKESVAVLRNDTAGSVARFLLGTPGATQTTIARQLGLAAPTVTKYVKRLERQGLVEVMPMGRSKIVQPTADLSSALAHAMPETNIPAMPAATMRAAPLARPVAA